MKKITLTLSLSALMALSFNASAADERFNRVA